MAYAQEALQSSALFNYPLLKLQEVVTPLDNCPLALFSALPLARQRLPAQRPLWLHVICVSTSTTRNFGSVSASAWKWLLEITALLCVFPNH